MRKALTATLILAVTVLVVLFAGPIASGAVFLVLPNLVLPATAVAAHGAGQPYEPVHKGHAAMPTGIYIRENDDLVVPGTPALVLRRSYNSMDRVSRQFGIGAWHNGEIFLSGDGKTFQWAKLILTGGAHIPFERTSAGSSLFNAMFQSATAGEWQGARLGWTGVNWALRKPDGTLMIFRGCGPGRACAIVQWRDADGHVVDYHRDWKGTLQRIESSDDRWIAFEYDGSGRVARAHDSAGGEVRYEYDGPGRLSKAVARDGSIYRYTYNSAHQLETIQEPAAEIENSYDGDGRCVKQVNYFADGSAPYTFTFAYKVADGRVIESETRESSGTTARYVFQDGGYTASETWERGPDAVTFAYDRDPATGAVTSLTLTCRDRTGQPLRHSSFVRPGEEEWIKFDLVRTRCHWSSGRSKRSPG